MTTSRRLAAIVATDVVGYSRLMVADEDGTRKQRYKGNVEYSYIVDGTQFTNDRIRIGQWVGDYTLHRSIPPRPEDLRVDVYYNPNEPADSVLIPGISWVVEWPPLILAVACAADVVFSWILRRRKKKISG